MSGEGLPPEFPFHFKQCHCIECPHWQWRKRDLCSPEHWSAIAAGHSSWHPWTLLLMTLLMTHMKVNFVLKMFFFFLLWYVYLYLILLTCTCVHVRVPSNFQNLFTMREVITYLRLIMGRLVEHEPSLSFKPFRPPSMSKSLGSFSIRLGCLFGGPCFMTNTSVKVPPQCWKACGLVSV